MFRRSIFVFIIVACCGYAHSDEDGDEYVGIASCVVQVNSIAKENCYKLVIRDDPDNRLEAYLHISLLYISKSDFDSALHYMSEYVDEYKEEPHAYATLGLIHKELDNLEEALESVNVAIDSGIDHPFIYSLRGEIYFELNEYEKAIADFTIELQFDSASSEIYILRGDSYRMLGRYQEALSDYRSAIEKYGDAPLISDEGHELEYFSPGEVKAYIKQMEVLREMHLNVYDLIDRIYKEAVTRNSVAAEELEEAFQRITRDMPSRNLPDDN